MIINVQCSKLSKSGSEKRFKMYYLLKRLFDLVVMTANRFWYLPRKTTVSPTDVKRADVHNNRLYPKEMILATI